MARSLILLIVTAYLSGLFFTGCGAGLSTVKDDTPELHTTIDPFDFSDEFVSASLEKEISKMPTERSYNADSLNVKSDSPSNEMILQKKETTGEVQSMSAEVMRGYRIQVGAYEEKENAERMRDYVQKKMNLPVYLEYQPPFFRVRAGNFKDIHEAEKYVEIFRKNGFNDARWVPSTITSQR